MRDQRGGARVPPGSRGVLQAHAAPDHERCRVHLQQPARCQERRARSSAAGQSEPVRGLRLEDPGARDPGADHPLQRGLLHRSRRGAGCGHPRGQPVVHRQPRGGQHPVLPPRVRRSRDGSLQPDRRGHRAADENAAARADHRHPGALGIAGGGGGRGSELRHARGRRGHLLQPVRLHPGDPGRQVWRAQRHRSRQRRGARGGAAAVAGQPPQPPRRLGDRVRSRGGRLHAVPRLSDRHRPARRDPALRVRVVVRSGRPRVRPRDVPAAQERSAARDPSRRPPGVVRAPGRLVHHAAGLWGRRDLRRQSGVRRDRCVGGRVLDGRFRPGRPGRGRDLQRGLLHHAVVRDLPRRRGHDGAAGLLHRHALRRRRGGGVPALAGELLRVRRAGGQLPDRPRGDQPRVLRPKRGRHAARRRVLPGQPGHGRRGRHLRPGLPVAAVAGATLPAQQPASRAHPRLRLQRAGRCLGCVPRRGRDRLSRRRGPAQAGTGR